MRLESMSDIKIQHHTDIRGQHGLLCQMFIIMAEWETTNTHKGCDTFYICAQH